MRFTGQNKRAINPKYFLNEEAPFRTLEEKRQEYPKYIRAMDIVEDSPVGGVVQHESWLSQAGAVIYSMFLRDIAGDNQVDPIAVAESMVADLKASNLGDKETEGPIGIAKQMGASLDKDIVNYKQSFSTLKKNVESHVKHAMTPEYQPQPQPQPEPEPLTATKPEFAPDISNRRGVVCRAAYLVQVQAEKALTASGRTDLLPRVQDYKRFKNKTAIMGTVTLAILNKALEDSGEKPFAPTDFAGACRDAARVMKVAPKIATIDVASVIERRGGSAVASAAPQGQPSSALTESKIRDASYNRIKEEKNKKLFEALIKG